MHIVNRSCFLGSKSQHELPGQWGLQGAALRWVKPGWAMGLLILPFLRRAEVGLDR